MQIVVCFPDIYIGCNCDRTHCRSQTRAAFHGIHFTGSASPAASCQLSVDACSVIVDDKGKKHVVYQPGQSTDDWKLKQAAKAAAAAAAKAQAAALAAGTAIPPVSFDDAVADI